MRKTKFLGCCSVLRCILARSRWDLLFSGARLLLTLLACGVSIGPFVAQQVDCNGYALRNERQAGGGPMLHSGFLGRALLKLEYAFTHSLEGFHPVVAVKKAVTDIRRLAVRAHDRISVLLHKIEGRSTVSPEPGELVKAMTAKATAEAVSWGADERQYPTKFSIMLSPEAWETFYGVAEDVSGRLARTTSSHLNARLETNLEVHVQLACDQTYVNGEYSIDAFFESHVDAIPQEDSDGEPRSYDAMEPTDNTSCQMNDFTAPVCAKASCQTPAYKGVLGSAMLYYEGRGFSIHDEDTLGVERADSSQASIVLPFSSNLTYMSSLHAAFFWDPANGWRYRQLGKNGSSIYTEAGRIDLAKGQSASLPPVCEIIVPGMSRSRIFFRMDNPGQEVPATLLRSF